MRSIALTGLATFLLGLAGCPGESTSTGDTGLGPRDAAGADAGSVGSEQPDTGADTGAQQDALLASPSDSLPQAAPDAPVSDAQALWDTLGPGDVGPPSDALDAGDALGAADVPDLPDGTNSADSTDSADTGEAPGCPPGLICVGSLPFTASGDTSTAGTSSDFDFYACKPTVDESGPEVVYRVAVQEAGFLSAAVYDDAGVDVDVHILNALDADACLDRGHHHARADVAPGVYFVVVDTYVEAGEVFAGPYLVDIGLTVPSSGACGMETGVMERVGDGGDHLEMPATGPIVGEAHLVTQEEPPPYPSTSSEGLEAHYELSQSETGLVMHRQEVWAPLEGGSFYGAGIGSPTAFPVLHEAWYVNMYWTKNSRPDKGTRMILHLPGTSRAVVVAAGYETGPGNLAHIGGTPEETHFYLGTSHLSVMTIGIATDQSLPFGPRVCTP